MKRRGDESGHAVPVALLVILPVAIAVGGSGSALGATLLVASTGERGSGRRLLSLAMHLAGGAVVGGLVGYGVASVATSGMTTLGVGFGLALGGASGLVTTLLREGENQSDESEAVTVETDENESPEPQPADLFTRHPDPLLYYEDEGNGPVGRAANPAFEEWFDVGTSTVMGAPVVDVLMAVDGPEELADAVATDESVDVTVTCETASGTGRFRLRTAAVTDGPEARGYVVYTPIEE